jgi:hypothetical protein
VQVGTLTTHSGGFLELRRAIVTHVDKARRVIDDERDWNATEGVEHLHVRALVRTFAETDIWHRARIGRPKRRPGRYCRGNRKEPATTDWKIGLHFSNSLLI